MVSVTRQLRRLFTHSSFRFNLKRFSKYALMCWGPSDLDTGFDDSDIHSSSSICIDSFDIGLKKTKRGYKEAQNRGKKDEAPTDIFFDVLDEVTDDSVDDPLTSDTNVQAKNNLSGNTQAEIQKTKERKDCHRVAEQQKEEPILYIFQQIAPSKDEFIAGMQCMIEDEAQIEEVEDIMTEAENITDEMRVDGEDLNKNKADKECAKFRETNLEIYPTHYAPLFRDSVAVGDETMTLLKTIAMRTNFYVKERVMT
ncbi:hypothetical protein M8C21_009976 [Ambrosia artemisiifolia]|uniref:Uncharacterized protein n=1 Tax=Ambrosia artemisiifolia TaxID=4212 RepID=A0AAD5GVD0_AMBAR|nr:hypothetical protein M8C21_009976 [Ambrosia artemisiifolia]